MIRLGIFDDNVLRTLNVLREHVNQLHKVVAQFNRKTPGFEAPSLYNIPTFEVTGLWGTFTNFGCQFVEYFLDLRSQTHEPPK